MRMSFGRCRRSKVYRQCANVHGFLDCLSARTICGMCHMRMASHQSGRGGGS